jgi:ABC-type transport system involved in multi-copper enzyme maturation permease subunit
VTFLPIVERELRVAARRRGTYWLRTLSALFAIAIFGWLLLLLLHDHFLPAEQGRYLFRTLFGGAFLYCLLAGARLTADCISEEKREGTLGLLFLTDLTSFDIVIGKLAVTSLSSAYAVLAIVPVVALPVQLGGITGTELWQAALVLLNTTFFSLTAGLLISTLSLSERNAMFATVFIIVIATCLPFMLAITKIARVAGPGTGPPSIWPFIVASPAYPLCYMAIANTPVGTAFAMPAASFWGSVAGIHLAGWVLLLAACGILPSVWQTRDRISWWQRQHERIKQWTFGHAETRRLHRTRLLDINPFLWLASRERAKPLYVWILLAAIGATWLFGLLQHGRIMFDKDVVVTLTLLTAGLLKIWVTSEACTRLAEDRRIGALELFLSTRLTIRDILRGHWLALRRQFARPLIVLVVLEFFLLRAHVGTRTWLMNAVLLVADTITLGWLGMWLGLTARNVSRAVLGSLGYVFALPWALFHLILFDADRLWPAPQLGVREERQWITDLLWMGLCLGADLVFGFWARRRLMHDFRQAAAQHYDRPRSHWLTALFRRPTATSLRAPLAAASE